ncbi:alcohol dehydrogenase catalytic domain-containing protein [Bradyrhizobium iriomotense]|uniref:alcohol dehydrogenase catalytic domain-containing protein n=1 Tax=Bradyrhizobium iriomotense TaxID=441950 RepID=UPI003D67C433
MIRGETPFETPCALGHEAIAEVVEVGPGARFYRGQIVVVSYHISCGSCFRCVGRGKPNTCAHYPKGAAFGLPTENEFGCLFADLVRIPHANASLVPVVPARTYPIGPAFPTTFHSATS